MKRKLLFAAFAALVSLGSWAQTWTGNEVAAGTFYLYNVDAAKFLNNGDPNQEWGTNAYLQAGFGMDVVLARISDGVYTIDTNVSNGGDSHYMNSSTWTDGAATQWQFRAVDGETNTYQIIYDGQYLMANQALNDVEMVGDPGSRVTSTYWKLVSEQDFKDAMVAKTYSAADPMDVSVFIKGRSFARNDGRNSSWTTSHNGGNWTWIGASDNKYYGNEAWNNTFDVHQTITGLPDGTYEVQCSGFGTNGTTYVYGNTTTGLLQTDNSTSWGNSKEAKWKAIHEDNAFAGQTTGTFTLSGGNLTVGIKRETNNGGDWCVWDEFRLYYYGLDLSEFAATLASAVSAAEAVEGTVPTAAYNALAAVVTENNKTYTTASAYTAAANAIVEATNTAKALQANYSRYNSVKTAILAINSGIDLSTANTQADEATTNDAIDVAVATARTALATYLAGAGIEDDEIDLTAAMIDNATPTSNGNYWTVTNASGEAATPNAYDSGTNTAEFWNQKGYSIRQTISYNLPAGYYTLTAQAITRTGMNGVLSANDNTVNIITMPKEGGTAGVDCLNNRTDCKNFFNAGNGVNTLTFQLEEAGNVTIGLTADNSTSDYWTVWRSFSLEYLGTAPLSLFQDRLAAAVSAAESHATELSGTIPSAASTAYTNAINTAKAANTTTVECLQSISDIEAATASADALVAPYATYKSMAEAATTDGVASDVISAQDGAVEEATTVAAIQACTGVLQRARVVLAIGENENVDLTSFVINANFEQGNLTGWTSANGGNVANNNNFGLKQGTWYAERWQNGVALGAGSLTHDDIYLPAGFYKITADAQNIEQYNSDAAGKGLFLCANADQKEIGAAANYEVYVKLNSDDVLSIKFLQDNCTGNWISYDNITLTYVAADFPAYALVEGKMNATVAATQTSAKAAFDENATATNYIALINAISAAQASKVAYAAAAAALTKANDILNSTNVYTAEARTAYANAIATAQAAYDDASMDDATANGLNAALNTAEWGAAQTLGAAYIGSAWSGTNIAYNFWSLEGDAEGSSGMTTPFIQYWVGDTEKLADNNISATLSGLENGLYSVTAFMRVTNKKEGDDAGYDGISFAVNDGTPVAFAEATEYSDGWAKEITAEGLVKDGSLVIKVAIEGTNASWVAFKNVKYTKVRDLTPEEMATAPTAIALFNGENEVTEPIALDATTQTVTLTPSYTPANATEGYISWASSDETVATVADGVVTAVSTGTTTITATSTLDNTVSASATVTVTFPETAAPAAYYVNNNATRTNYTPGENIIKNGAFEYPNAYYGWTVGTGAAMSADGFDIKTEEGNTYIKSKKGEGGGAVTSIKIGWPIESGKTYTFSYKIKGNAGKSSWTGTSLTNEIGTETFMIEREFNVTTDWQTKTYTFTNTDGYAYLQFWARWYDAAYDDFYLAEVTSTTEGNVQYALDAIPTANIGTGAFQYSQDAIDAANALVQGTATVADVEAAYEALTTLNAPTAGKTYNIINNSTGYNYAGNAVTFKSASNADLTGNTTSMGYNEAPGSIYPQGVTFTAVDGVLNGYKLSYTRADGNTVYVGTGSSTGLGNNNNQIRPTTDASKAVTIQVKATTTEGVWNLYNTLASQNIGANGANDQGFYTTASYSSMTLQEAVNNEVSLSILAANQYGTLILPFDAEVPTGVTAYSVSETSGATLTLTTEDAFVANTPYIVFAENGAAATLAGLGSAYTDATYTPNGSLLTGVYAETAIPVGSYGLQNQGDGAAFYLVDNTVTKKITANHAYLTVPSSNGVKAFYFGDTETAIKSVFDGVAAGDIYDLNGRKVTRMQKGGIYVVNGRKVMVK